MRSKSLEKIAEYWRSRLEEAIRTHDERMIKKSANMLTYWSARLRDEQMGEYIIEITDDVLRSLGWTPKEAEKHRLVRCKDCRYYCADIERCSENDFDIRRWEPNDYCSAAERKEE